jgi:hypothetical protein
MPALAYVRELSVWVVVNYNGNMIAWTDDVAEADRLSLWVLDYEKTAKPFIAIASNTGGRKLRRVSPRRNVVRSETLNQTMTGDKTAVRKRRLRFGEIDPFP